MCLNASGVFVASKLHMEMVEIMGNRSDPNILGFYNFGNSFASPSGKIHFRKTHPKREMKSLKNSKFFKQPNYS